MKIDEIGIGGKHLEVPLPQADYETLLEEAGAGCHARSEVSVSLDLSKTAERVRILGALASRIACTCRRCASEVEVEVPGRFELFLRPAVPGELPGVEGEDTEDLGAGERSGTFALEQADEDTYEGGAFETWPLVREQILLSLPDYLLCREDCKGLCVVCGADLNEGECGCDRTVPDPRLAKLKDIKLP